jgi:hypothetical protein
VGGRTALLELDVSVARCAAGAILVPDVDGQGLDRGRRSRPWPKVTLASLLRWSADWQGGCVHSWCGPLYGAGVPQPRILWAPDGPPGACSYGPRCHEPHRGASLQGRAAPHAIRPRGGSTFASWLGSHGGRAKGSFSLWPMVRSACRIGQLEMLDSHHEDDIIPVVLKKPDHHGALAVAL